MSSYGVTAEGPADDPDAPASFEPLVTALINELAVRPEGDQVLLVLDDYHVIASVDWFAGFRPSHGIAIGIDFAAGPLSAGLACWPPSRCRRP